MIKKLKAIKTLVSKPMTLDSLPMPKMPTTDSKPKGIKAPKAGEQESKKDPTKMAEQLKDAGEKKSAKDAIKVGADKLVKTTENGQWYLDPEDT